MGKQMSAFFAEGYGKGRIDTVTVPELKDNEVLIKISYCGVCGTDQDLFSSDCSFAKNGEDSYPARLGHEWSGVVEKVGKNVTRVTVGDRVVGDNIVCCGKCESCLKGDYGNCTDIRYLGTIDPIYDGAFAEYLWLPEYHVYKIPDTLSLKDAALCEPLSVAYGATRKMNIKPDSTVAIIGTGCIGLSAAVLAKCAGAKEVFLVGRNPVKLAAAERLGVTVVNIKECDAIEFIKSKTDGEGADFIIECSGAEGTIVQAMDMAKKRGFIALIGFYENEEKNINIDRLVSKELIVQGIMGEFGNVDKVLEILGEHNPNISPIITDELPFAECEKGFVRKNYPNAIKIMISIGE